ncbi:hypothetical protein ACW5R3_11795 [Bizionia sp. KMM 8389]
MINLKTGVLIVSWFLVLKLGYAQTELIQGVIQSTADVENIHVINKTAQRFTISNAQGAFKIGASLNDTLVFSSVQHQTKNVIITQKILKNKTLVVLLKESITELNQVVVGKILSGDMQQDISNVEGVAFTAKSAGIPSYEGPVKTQSERRLNEATTGGGLIPLNPILNGISGRTKKLKHQVELESREDLMMTLRNSLSEDLFSKYPLDDAHVNEYFYFVSEQPDFMVRCSNKSAIERLDYLIDKLHIYKQNLNN